MIHVLTSHSLRDHLNGSAKPMLVGAIFGLLFLGQFVLRVDPNHPDWGNFWMIQPLVMGAIAGAGAGFFFYYMSLFRLSGITKIMSLLLCLVIFVIAMWMGTVLGLHGTMWN